MCLIKNVKNAMRTFEYLEYVTVTSRPPSNFEKEKNKKESLSVKCNTKPCAKFEDIYSGCGCILNYSSATKGFNYNKNYLLIENTQVKKCYMMNE